MDSNNGNRRKKPQPPPAPQASIARVTRTLAALRKERAHLEEEVRQLRAAVKVYAELAKRAAAKHDRAMSAPRPGK